MGPRALVGRWLFYGGSGWFTLGGMDCSSLYAGRQGSARGVGEVGALKNMRQRLILRRACLENFAPLAMSIRYRSQMRWGG